MLKRSSSFRAAHLVSSFPLIMAILAGCGGITVVSPPDTSTADRPAAYTPATQGPGGFYYGTHFRYAMPSGWQNAKPPSANIEVWMKQEPVSQPEPIVGVTVFNSPDNVPVEAYTDVSFHKDLKGGGHAIGGITTVTVDGHRAQSYEISGSGTVDQTIVVFRGGVAYVIDLGATPSEFASATAGPFRAFLASWRWN
jgi:hypothetical protein